MGQHELLPVVHVLHQLIDAVWHALVYPPSQFNADIGQSASNREMSTFSNE